MIIFSYGEKMVALICLWMILFLFFVCVPSFYFLYLRKISTKNWNINADSNYLPSVTIMVPMHNEEKVIRLKLENLAKLVYPKEKMQILLVDDASTDRTLREISEFSKSALVDFTVVTSASRQGKMKALNNALKYATGEIIIISDSDAFLSPDILLKTMPFFADCSVGALISKEELINPKISWVSETEKFYFDLVYGIIKLGESKIHSTIMFHGGFAAYRRSFLQKFDVEADDTGTALDIVQRGGRTIMVPEAVSYSLEFAAWRDKFNAKVRRATQNLKTWVKCFSLLLKRKLMLPWKIAIPGIFLYLFNPIIFLLLLITTFYMMLTLPLFALLLASMITFTLTIKRLRVIFIEVIQNHVFLLLAIIGLLTRRNIILWKTAQHSRAIITREMLETLSLV